MNKMSMQTSDFWRVKPPKLIKNISPKKVMTIFYSFLKGALIDKGEEMVQ